MSIPSFAYFNPKNYLYATKLSRSQFDFRFHAFIFTSCFHFWSPPHLVISVLLISCNQPISFTCSLSFLSSHSSIHPLPDCPSRSCSDHSPAFYSAWPPGILTPLSVLHLISVSLVILLDFRLWPSLPCWIWPALCFWIKLCVVRIGYCEKDFRGNLKIWISIVCSCYSKNMLYLNIIHPVLRQDWSVILWVGHDLDNMILVLRLNIRLDVSWVWPFLFT